ncbi:cell division protein FtsQ/DivIB [Caproiciproducens faecalis]|uniref:FtsQ-type POTRA domain-containing protein n=1 Tax=Caproiciproducens faecalis TaxID=2820301 RepID=A0ABS7DK56_9FIRM|nr:FtsQ-type POTRA domain-containing protein [Caproiciproducens faecalis]MBW7571680.1 FtsQ-type POTRA domain-containing protein [Caproiciproducens faecalis]
MDRNRKDRKNPIPRVYDKNSGEYRPVSDWEEQGGGRKGKYATPKSRADTRKRRRRRFLLLFYIFLFLAVIVGAVVVSLTVLFKIEAIEVVGTSRYPAQAIVQAGGIQKGENLFLAHTKNAAASIEQKLPYIGTAKVSRRLPAKIVIEVTQEAVSGAMEYKGKYAVVSANGKVLELATKMPENCTSIKGLSLSKAEVGKDIVYGDTSQKETFQELSAAVTNNKLGKITEMDFSNPYKILIVYDGRIIMNLGLPSDFDYKIRFAKSILDAGKIKDNERGTLNLSVAVEENNAFFDPNYSVTSSSAAQSSQNSSG